MANGDIPPAEQSVAKIIDLQHKIAEEHTTAGCYFTASRYSNRME